MIRPKITAVAEAAIFDSQNGASTLVNILEVISPLAPFPFTFARMTFWVAFERELTDPTTANFKFRLSFNERELSAMPVLLNFPENQIITNLAFNLNGLTLDSHGRVEFRLFNDDGTVFTEYLLLIQALPPEVKITQPDSHKSSPGMVNAPVSMAS